MFLFRRPSLAILHSVEKENDTWWEGNYMQEIVYTAKRYNND